MWTSTMWMWKSRRLSEEEDEKEGRKPKLDQREGARKRVSEPKRIRENVERDRERE